LTYNSLVDSPDAPPGQLGSRDGAAPALRSRVVRTFTSPARLFAEFHDGSPWLGVLAISTLVAMVAAATLPADYFLREMVDPVTRLGKPVQITSSPAEIVRWGRYRQVLSALAMHPLIPFALAGLLSLVFTVLGRGRATFRQYLAVSAHALLIPALGTVIAIAMRLMSSDPSAEPTVAKLLWFAGPAVARNAFLASLNVFSLWMLIVLGVAVAVLDGRPSWIRPATALLGIYMLLAGASVLIAS
jgi:hypothetical protein